MKLSIIIPYRYSGNERHKLFKKVKKQYETYFPEAEIIISDSFNNNLLNLSKIRNNGVKQSHNPLLIIADADLFISKEDLNNAIKIAENEGFCFPFGPKYSLTQPETLKILNGEPLKETYPNFWDFRAQKQGGGIHIITRKLFNQIGGYDERFTGWGWEDREMCWKVYETIGKLPINGDGKAYHLYHTHYDGWGSNEPSNDNYDLFYNVLGRKDSFN